MKHINHIFKNIDPNSLRVRLTIVIAAFSAMGLGSLAIWTTWKMQHILIDSHKQTLQELAERLPRDVQVYNDMYPLQTSLEKAVKNSTTSNTVLWVKNQNNQILVTSNSFKQASESTQNKLVSLTQMPITPQIHQVNQKYFVLCSSPLQIKSQLIGDLSVAHDITREQTMFVAMVQSLSVASILVIIIISGAIAFYIRRSLQPLRQLSQMTEAISAEDLGKAQLYLQNAPSEVKELAQTCNQMLMRLSDSWEGERQFVSNISHELRTPLTIVHGYLQSVLRRRQNLTETQTEALQTAALEAENTIQMLEDLLNLARADSGNLHYKIQVCVLNDLVAEVVGMAKQHSDRQIDIEAEVNPIEVKLDYNYMKQVLLNLIDNAVKYSDAGTPITLKLKRQGGQAMIQVCDRGYGIPLQQQSRIFERFYRVDEARNRAGGTGLGLSIVKTLVEGMGGNITVRSKLKQGSIFQISFPVLV
ncbi:MAG: ATP-binding protein [Calothrix sp. MO_192.B10]|nr:ATP-binding protein [Calothrix sp. MO_192.B10]